MIYDAGLMMGADGEHPDFFFFNDIKTKILKFQFGIQYVDWLELPVLTGVQDFEIVGEKVYVLCVNGQTVSIHTYTDDVGWQLYASYTTSRSSILGELRTTKDGSIIYYVDDIYSDLYGIDAIVTDTGVKLIEGLLGDRYSLCRGFIGYYYDASNIPLKNIIWDSLVPVEMRDGNPVYDVSALVEPFISLGGGVYDYIRCIGSSNDGKGLFVYGSLVEGGMQGEYYDGETYKPIYQDPTARLYWVIGSLDNGFLTSHRYSSITPDSFDDSMEKEQGRVLIITTAKNLRYYVGSTLYYTETMSWFPDNIKVVVPTS